LLYFPLRVFNILSLITIYLQLGKEYLGNKCLIFARFGEIYLYKIGLISFTFLLTVSIHFFTKEECGKKKWGNQILKIEKDRTQWQQRDKRISNDLHIAKKKSFMIQKS
jgi:hypothetical protein